MYARNYPPKNATREKWIELIDGKWSNENWLVINTLKILITSEVCSHFHPDNIYLYMHWINALHRSYNGVMFIRLFDLSNSLYYTYLEGDINLYCKLYI